MQDAQSWIIEETKKADFGDQRLNKRYGNLLNHFISSPNKSIPAACKSWKETMAAYRFFNHEEVSFSDILAPHRESTLKRIKNEKIVLIPQDTTEINFSGRKITGMGYLSGKDSLGFYLHPALALTPERLCLGVVDMQTWTRKSLGKRKKRTPQPLEEKESYCWLKGYEAANAIAMEAPDTVIISMADRGGDIYELLEKMPSETNKAYWLIRSSHDRSIVNESGEELGLKLRETIRASKSIGEIEFHVPAGTVYSRRMQNRYPRKERLVRQEVRTGTMFITKEKKQPAIAINVVHCREIDAPNKNEEERIEWFLITSYPVSNPDAAMEIVKWYLCRWQIEVFFKILKSGCTVEELQFETLKATENCIAIYLIVAWRILYLTMLGRDFPDMDCSVVFEKSEWQSVYAIVTKKSPPDKPPRLKEIILMIAKLGGFLGRKSDGYPGPQVMWIGLQRMKDFTTSWETFYSLQGKTYV